MNVQDAIGISAVRQRQLARALQLVLLGLVLYGLYRGNFALVVNGAVSLFVTFLPALLRREYDVGMDAGLVLWITVAVFLHSLGMLGVYQRFAWYDSISHVVSAAVVAAAGYASVRALDVHYEKIHIPRPYMFVFIFVFIMAFGVLWELLEFAAEQLGAILGGGSVLVVYGVDDIVMDIIFNAIGGVIVALWGTAYLSDYVRGIAGWLTHHDGE